MKKILIGIIIGFVVIIGGCAALFGAGVSSVDNAIKEVEQQTANADSKIQEMAKNIKWEVKKEAYSTKIVGVFENTSDEKIDYVEFEYKLIADSKIQEMAKNIKWEVKKEAYSTKIVGVFENTSDEKIDYVEFEYKLIDSEGTVIESSFTNETEVSPGEKRKVEILCIENDFEKFEVNAKSSAF